MIEERADELVRVGYIKIQKLNALDIVYLAEAVHNRYGISKNEIKIETINNQIITNLCTAK